jgi:hypothetical protein
MSWIQALLWIGDIVTLIILTLVGFATHGELNVGLPRMLAIFIPLLITWLVAATPIGALRLETARDFRQLWRPGWAMLLATPLAVILRGLIISRPVAPIFGLVLAGSGIIAIFIWRGIFAFLAARLPK